jgi:hypothetical protein
MVVLSNQTIDNLLPLIGGYDKRTVVIGFPSDFPQQTGLDAITSGIWSAANPINQIKQPNPNLPLGYDWDIKIILWVHEIYGSLAPLMLDTDSYFIPHPLAVPEGSRQRLEQNFWQVLNERNKFKRNELERDNEFSDQFGSLLLEAIGNMILLKE